jgi:hypothetical protein
MRRAAPAVAWPIGPQPLWQGLNALLMGSGGAALALVVLCVGVLPLPVSLLLTGLAAAAAAAYGWRAAWQAPGELLWTGDGWRWRIAAGADLSLRALRVRVDAGGWLLVQVRPHGVTGTRWLAVSRSGAATHNRPDADQALAWTAFRAALYSPATPSDGPPVRRPADPE